MSHSSQQNQTELVKSGRKRQARDALGWSVRTAYAAITVKQTEEALEHQRVGIGSPIGGVSFVGIKRFLISSKAAGVWWRL